MGKRSTDIIPNQEPDRFKFYQHLSETGETTLDEVYITDVNRWLRLYRMRLGGPGSDLLAAVFEDITERKQRELEQEYLLKLADTLRPLSDAVEIQRTAMRVLGEQLQVDRVLYSELDANGETYIISDNYVREGYPKLIGHFPANDFSPVSEKLQAGETFAIADITSDERLSEEARAAFIGFDVYASVGVPLIKGGRWVANLGIQHGRVRAWTEGEIALVQETAERTWAAVERAKAEETLRLSEEKLRTTMQQLELSIAAGKIGIWHWDLKSNILRWSQEQEALYGLQPGEFAGGVEDFLQFVYKEDVDKVVTVEAVEQMIESDFAENFRIKRKDGEIRWIHSKSKKLLNSEGSIE